METVGKDISTPTVPDLHMQLALQYRVLSEIHAQSGEAIVKEQENNNSELSCKIVHNVLSAIQ